MSSSNSEQRLLGTMIVALSVPSIGYWMFQLLPTDTLNELLNSERGSPAAKSLWKFTTNMAFVSPVFFGLSIWALRRIWATISRTSRIGLLLFVAATGSILLYLLFNVLILTTGNFT